MMENNTKNTKAFYNTEIPSDWDVKELGELFNFKNGINAGKESYGKGVKFINVMEVIYHDYIFPEMIPGTVQISDEQKELYLVKDGDVLFNRTSETIGEIGLSAVFNGNEDVVFGGFVIRGRPIVDAIDNLFKRYCLRSTIVRSQIIKGGQGAVRTNIGQGDLSQIKIPLPPLPEQKAIAQVLSTADAAIHTTEKLITQKELRKKWLMQQLLTGKKRLKGFVGEWKEKRLGEVAEIDKLTLSSQTPPDYSFQYISLSDVDAGTAEIKSERIIFKNSPSRARRIVQKGDVLLATVRPNLQAFLIIRDDVKDLIASTGFAVITCKKINNEFLFQYLFSKGLMNQIEAFLTGSNYPAINSSDVKQLKFPYPSIEEQAAIAQVLQAADKEISLLKAKAEKLREQKKGLMQQLLTGKVRLKIKE